MPGNGAKVRARRAQVTVSGRFPTKPAIRITCSSLSRHRGAFRIDAGGNSRTGHCRPFAELVGEHRCT